MNRGLMIAAAAAAFSLGLSAQAQSIKIAVVGPMAFVQGENHWAGAELARDAINKAAKRFGDRVRKSPVLE